MGDKQASESQQNQTAGGKVRIDALIPADLADKLAKTADENDRTKTAEIIRALESHLDPQEEPAPRSR